MAQFEFHVTVAPPGAPTAVQLHHIAVEAPTHLQASLAASQIAMVWGGQAVDQWTLE